MVSIYRSAFSIFDYAVTDFVQNRMMCYVAQDRVHADCEFSNEIIAKLDMLSWFVRKLLEFITEESVKAQVFYE